MDILENEYDIPMEESIEEEVKTMCNLSEGIEERAMEAGRKEGKRLISGCPQNILPESHC